MLTLTKKSLVTTEAILCTTECRYWRKRKLWHNALAHECFKYVAVFNETLLHWSIPRNTIQNSKSQQCSKGHVTLDWASWFMKSV